jgi:murein DD-endopeptidase MepM/ murein hydrolase activator NlpD
MKQDKRFYTFIIAPTANSQFRKINIHYNVLYAILGLALIGFLTLGYGAYRLANHATLVVKYNLAQMENRRLRERNDEANHKYDRLQGRLAMMEPIQRKLAEANGISRTADLSSNVGSGGPSGGDITGLEQATASLELELLQIKEVFDKNQVKLASTPSIWPVRGYITDGFGSRSNPFGGGYEQHAGLDIATTFGTAVQATADGIVIFAANHAGYGNVVVIDHGYGLTTRYGHLSRIDVTVGQRVHRGAQVGAVGSTGRSTGPHCHYEVRLHDRPVNPLSYIPMGRS